MLSSVTGAHVNLTLIAVTLTHSPTSNTIAACLPPAMRGTACPLLLLTPAPSGTEASSQHASSLDVRPRMHGVGAPVKVSAGLHARRPAGPLQPLRGRPPGPAAPAALQAPAGLPCPLLGSWCRECEAAPLQETSDRGCHAAQQQLSSWPHLHSEDVRPAAVVLLDKASCAGPVVAPRLILATAKTEYHPPPCKNPVNSLLSYGVILLRRQDPQAPDPAMCLLQP